MTHATMDERQRYRLEKTLRGQISQVRESIRLAWESLASKDLPADHRKALRGHLEKCNATLKNYRSSLDALSAPD
jgi:hypothetical protein